MEVRTAFETLARASLNRRQDNRGRGAAFAAKQRWLRRQPKLERIELLRPRSRGPDPREVVRGLERLIAELAQGAHVGALIRVCVTRRCRRQKEHGDRDRKKECEQRPKRR